MALEEEMENLGENDLFARGLALVIDGTDAEIVGSILSNFVEQEHDPYKKKLKQIQQAAILDIQAGDSVPRIVMRLNSMVDIPDNAISSICAEYYCGGDSNVVKKISGIRWELPVEREEIRFMKRAFAVAVKGMREGILALEAERDHSLFAQGDVFEYGLALTIDRMERKYIETILDNMTAHEHDHWKRKMNRVKKTAVLSIYDHDNPNI